MEGQRGWTGKGKGLKEAGLRRRRGNATQKDVEIGDYNIHYGIRRNWHMGEMAPGGIGR